MPFIVSGSLACRHKAAAMGKTDRRTHAFLLANLAHRVRVEFELGVVFGAVGQMGVVEILVRDRRKDDQFGGPTRRCTSGPACRRSSSARSVRSLASPPRREALRCSRRSKTPRRPRSWSAIRRGSPKLAERGRVFTSSPENPKIAKRQFQLGVQRVNERLQPRSDVACDRPACCRCTRHDRLS